MISKQDHIDAFNQFAAGVTSRLSELTSTTWSVVTPAKNDSPSGLVIGDSERRFHFYLPMYGADGRVHVTGCYPDEAPGRSRVYVYPPLDGFKDGRSRPTINVGASRAPHHVAADIRRRFLPDYDAVRARIVDALAVEDDAAARQTTAVRSMATILGVPVPTSGVNAGSEVRSPVNDSAGYADFSPNHDGATWTIKLHSVPTPVAEEIARILAAKRP